MNQNEIKAGYLYALADKIEPVKGESALLVLALGVYDYAAYYHVVDYGADLELEYDDPAAAIQHFIDIGELTPAQGYTGGDGPFEAENYLREDHAHAGRWRSLWSQWAPRIPHEFPDHPVTTVEVNGKDMATASNIRNAVWDLPGVVFARLPEPFTALTVVWEKDTEDIPAHERLVEEAARVAATWTQAAQ